MRVTKIPGGEYRVLRRGTNQWSCLPGVPGYSHDQPGCFDPVFAGHEPHIHSVGIAYMYVGAWVPNKSGNGSGSDEFHVGPHIMIVSPHENQKELQPISREGSTACLTSLTCRTVKICISYCPFGSGTKSEERCREKRIMSPESQSLEDNKKTVEQQRYSYCRSWPHRFF